mmetsp:Transcript_32819/g.90639  ORF Transcript_32819/g.90639 Transcript_32819/m.90639 type:complete len:202 (+) Transcript_32819:500-1105(+)
MLLEVIEVCGRRIKRCGVTPLLGAHRGGPRTDWMLDVINLVACDAVEGGAVKRHARRRLEGSPWLCVVPRVVRCIHGPASSSSWPAGHPARPWRIDWLASANGMLDVVHIVRGDAIKLQPRLWRACLSWRWSGIHFMGGVIDLVCREVRCFRYAFWYVLHDNNVPVPQLFHMVIMVDMSFALMEHPGMWHISGEVALGMVL